MCTKARRAISNSYASQSTRETSRCGFLNKEAERIIPFALGRIFMGSDEWHIGAIITGRAKGGYQ